MSTNLQPFFIVPAKHLLTITQTEEKKNSIDSLPEMLTLNLQHMFTFVHSITA